jgi:TatD DNase family protein
VAVKKRLKPTVPLIIHGFNKNERVLAELLYHGFFISFGASTLSQKQAHTEGSSFAEMMRKIPLDRLFFETDDAENVAVSAIYEAAAKVLNLELSYLKSIVYDNFKKVF